MTDATDNPADVWRPLGFDDPDSARAYDALSEGVPPWMSPGIWNWIETNMAQGGDTALGEIPFWNRELAEQMHRRCRLEKPLYEGWDLAQGMASLRQVAARPDATLRVTDYLLSVFGDAEGRLQQVLEESGSILTVGDRSGRPGLVRRVPKGVQTAAEETMRSAGNAGRDLQEAWGDAFGRDPDASNAYRLAVRAVEHAASPVVTPKDAEPTLGKVINVMRDQGNWSLSLSREFEHAPSGEVLIKMCQMLWRGQGDRHGGGPDYSAATQQDAETAVLTAVPLVQWFSSGAVRRR